ncbi:MAG: hypothetical protein INH41_05980 [Myxococcaceae bacterium]|jgi:hypothetical protein|nr:hypothetical protein [Myxococcaceae bacterium]MCA3011935.1 hypothetical protein [Myxococcaceae bacterium]
MFDDLAFSLRSSVRASAPAWFRRVRLAEVLGGLDAAARGRAEALAARYEVGPWAQCLSRQAWRESLYALDLLDRLLPPGLPEGRALDVGAKNGAMLAGLATAAPRGWDAVEVDAHRRYLWGSTRRVYGEAVAAAFPGCRFIAGDVRALEGPWALATWFLPFLTSAPLRAWGLPARFLVPGALLEHVTSRIVAGGALLVVNQGEHEAALQQALFRERPGQVMALGRVESVLSPYRLPRYGWLWRPA